jgi:outer membrane protein TolC
MGLCGAGLAQEAAPATPAQTPKVAEPPASAPTAAGKPAEKAKSGRTGSAKPVQAAAPSSQTQAAPASKPTTAAGASPAPGQTAPTPATEKPAPDKPSAPGTSAAQTPALPPAPAQKPSTGVILEELLSTEGTERERRASQTIEQALQAGDQAGTWKRLKNKKLVKLSAADAALGALKRNLNIQVDRYGAEAARRAIMEAQAVFDPVFNLRIGYSEFNTYERRIRGSVNRQVFKPGTPGAAADERFVDLPAEVQDRTGIRRVIFGSFEAQRVEKDIFASSRQPNGPIQTTSYDISLSQQLPWGPDYDISVLTTDRDIFYDNRGNSFGASWASTLVFNLRLPLPGTRNFGPYSRLNTGLLLSKKSNEQAYWVLQSTINDTLLATNQAYLELIQRLEELRAQMENREILQQQATHIDRLFGQGAATTYDKAQIDSQLAQALAQEEAAKATFVTASDQLAVLIEYANPAVRNNVYLPAGYVPWVESRLTVDTGQALAVAQARRPELHLSQTELALSEIARNGAAVEARPDIRVDASVAAVQNGSVYGYKSYQDSIGSLDDPDTLNQTYAVSYRYPWRNQALKARLAQAELTVQDRDLALRATGNDVARDVNDALASLNAARARVERTEQALNAALKAYNSVARRAEIGGDVNANEVLLNVRTLLTAKLARIAAAVDNKRAEAALLAAQGVIGPHYASVVAANPLERMRLDKLADQGGLKYFLR